MEEAKRRADIEIRAKNLDNERRYSLNLHHLYRLDRDYFLDEGAEGVSTEYNSTGDEDLVYLGFDDRLIRVRQISQLLCIGTVLSHATLTYDLSALVHLPEGLQVCARADGGRG
jgi:hypothetical protein